MSRLYFAFGVMIGWMRMRAKGGAELLVELVVEGGDKDLVVDDFGSRLGIDHEIKNIMLIKGCCYIFNFAMMILLLFKF